MKNESDSSSFANRCERPHHGANFVNCYETSFARTEDWGLRTETNYPGACAAREEAVLCLAFAMGKHQTDSRFKIEIQNARYNRIQISTIRCECVCESGEGWGHFL